ncbi:MAG: conjugative transposon protein TraN [Thalassobius sp.]|nr:conjugative transposon protein TraN [Thalassovita sp.]
MKTVTHILIFLLVSNMVFGQQESTIPKLYVNEDVTTHFILSEPITYVDISVQDVKGDQPEPNILRIRPIKLKEAQEKYKGIVSIVCQSYIVQYELVYTSSSKATKYIKIKSEDGVGLINSEITVSTPEMKSFCLKSLNEKPTYHSVKSTNSKMVISLNNLYTVGDYFFIDVTFKNHTKIKYDIDQIRFKIEDKRKVKRTNYQEVELQEVYKLYDTKEFKSKHRNVFVFKKFTFPDQKVFTIEIAENQISGRRVKLDIDYSDILNADTL